MWSAFIKLFMHGLLPCLFRVLNFPFFYYSGSRGRKRRIKKLWLSKSQTRGTILFHYSSAQLDVGGYKLQPVFVCKRISVCVLNCIRLSRQGPVSLSKWWLECVVTHSYVHPHIQAQVHTKIHCAACTEMLWPAAAYKVHCSSPLVSVSVRVWTVWFMAQTHTLIGPCWL